MERKPIGLTVPYREVGYKEKNEWVGLTLDEQSACYEKSGGNLSRFAKAIEQLLKEKNAQKK